MRQLFTFLLCVWIAGASFAQGTAYIFKGGLSLANQQWNNHPRDMLLSWHATVSAESLSELDQASLFAQLGYHTKGSALRYGNTLFRDVNNNFFNPPNDRFLFRNLSLILGGKKRFLTDVGHAYFLVGVRLDYTLSTNLSDYESVNQRLSTLYFPQDEFVNKFNYGFSFGGGFELPISEYVRGIIELNIHPDISRQYYQPPITDVYDPISGNNRNFGERSIRNLTFELSVGLRLLHKVEYID